MQYRPLVYFAYSVFEKNGDKITVLLVKSLISLSSGYGNI